MITEKNNLKSNQTFVLPDPWERSKTAVFDIETTGFSPKAAIVYQIGALFYSDGHWQTIQWLCETPADESIMIETFFLFLKDFQYLIHFNGDTFDLPFLQKRCELLSLPCSFDGIESVDLFKQFRPLKKLLKRSSMTLKSWEQFLCLNRADTLDGGELIPLFHQFCQSPSHDTLELLLLHNHDDLIGTGSLLSLFSYQSFLNGGFLSEEAPQTDIINGKLTLIFHLKLLQPVPVRISAALRHGYLILEDCRCSLSIYALEDTLKYFFPDYKNYYYLPMEDTALHKSVASYVDASHREQAKASNCYCKKSGCFLPGTSLFHVPLFQYAYRDSDYYMEYQESLFENSQELHDYLMELIQQS